MARITVVVSQGQSANPVKRKLEEDLVAALLFERGVEVTVIPHLYDLPPDGTGMLCLQGITGDVVVLSWLYPRAAHWILDRNSIGGRPGKTLLVSDEEGDDELDDEMAADEADADDKPRVIDSRPVVDRTIYCIDLRAANAVELFLTEIRRIAAETSVQTVNVDLMGWIQGSPKPEQLQRYLDPTHDAPRAVSAQFPTASPQSLAPSPQPPAPSAPPLRIEEPTARRWYPVIDFSRCTNCLECLDFCLFGVYGISAVETILVEQPDNCRKGCPACSRVCPENAIIFPQHKSPAIAGSPNGEAGGLKIDLSKLFGAPDALEQAVLERDVELVAAGQAAVGMAVGIPKRQTSPAPHEKDELDSLMDR
ncbi:MAG TPA: ferredoxin family protein, partial [Pirellulales bacterium]